MLLLKSEKLTNRIIEGLSSNARICLVRGENTPKYFERYAEVSNLNIVHELIHRGNPYHHVYKDRINCEILLAIGGGSVIDSAKLLIYYGEINFSSGVNFIAIPTTCGSGSEATNFAVEYISNKKYSRISKDILPTKSILIPETVPNKITPSFVDAVCQSVESYFSTKANSYSREFSKKAFYLLSSSVDLDSGTIKSKINAIQGAHLAGCAINIAKTNAAHAFSYYLTANHGIPHGFAVLSSELFFISRIKEDYLINDLFLEEAENFLIKLKKTINWRSYSPFLTQEYLNAVNKERLNNFPLNFQQKDLLNYVKDFFRDF